MGHQLIYRSVEVLSVLNLFFVLVSFVAGVVRSSGMEYFPHLCIVCYKT